MSLVSFKYYRSDNLRKQLLAETGDVAEKEAFFELDMCNIEPETRSLIVSAWGEPRTHNEWYEYSLLVYSEPYVTQYGSIVEPTGPLFLEHDATLQDVLDNARAAIAQREKINALKPEAERIRSEATAARDAEITEILAEKDRLRAARDKARAEKAEWVAAHGSDFLKAAVEAGYDCQRRYITERVALECPGAVVDFDNSARWKDRSCPSERAFEFAQKVGGKVVWEIDPDEREAVIKDHLGYTIIYRYFDVET